MSDISVADDLKRGLRRLVISNTVLFLILIVLAVVGWILLLRIDHALCSFRGGLEDGVARSQQFLDKHPHGIPGIPRSVIQSDIDSQNRTINDLSGLHCPRR